MLICYCRFVIQKFVTFITFVTSGNIKSFQSVTAKKVPKCHIVNLLLSLHSLSSMTFVIFVTQRVNDDGGYKSGNLKHSRVHKCRKSSVVDSRTVTRCQLQSRAQKLQIRASIGHSWSSPFKSVFSLTTFPLY